MVIMSVDYGDVRTGIAVCDKKELLASPVGVIKETDKDLLVEKIKAYAVEYKAQMLVVGLPKNMDGTEGFRADACKILAESLKTAIGIPVEMYDERLTTVSAHNYLNMTDTRGKKRKAVIDSVSAVLILEDFIAKRKNSLC